MSRKRREVRLTGKQRRQLEHLRDKSSKSYLRERAAAILKVADGDTMASVAAQGLLRRREPETVSGWIDRWEAEGISGLYIKPGRGRQAAFSPSKPGRSAE
jgi:hypothetical protein